MKFQEDFYPNFTTLFSTAVPWWCHTCGNRNRDLPCGMRDINMDIQITCPRGHSYCMTDIVQDSKGYMDVYKR